MLSINRKENRILIWKDNDEDSFIVRTNDKNNTKFNGAKLCKLLLNCFELNPQGKSIQMIMNSNCINGKFSLKL